MLLFHIEHISHSFRAFASQLLSISIYHTKYTKYHLFYAQDISKKAIEFQEFSFSPSKWSYICSFLRKSNILNIPWSNCNQIKRGKRWNTNLVKIMQLNKWFQFQMWLSPILDGFDANNQIHLKIATTITHMYTKHSYKRIYSIRRYKTKDENYFSLEYFWQLSSRYNHIVFWILMWVNDDENFTFAKCKHLHFMRNRKVLS